MSKTFAFHRAPFNDSEFNEGIAELAKLIGATEAATPSWTRRLVLAADKASDPEEWALMIDNCAKPDSILPGLAVWVNTGLLVALPTAFSLADAVAILTGHDSANPEAILRERRAQMKEHENEVAAELAAKTAEQEKEREAAEQEARDRLTFNASGWEELEPWQQMLYALSMRVQARDGEFASDLRDIAEESQRCRPAALPFPRQRWR